MIPAYYKFPLRTEFLHFRASAKRLVSPHFTIYLGIHSRSEKSDPTLRECLCRMSVVVPKKLSKLATTRNWLKRLTCSAVWPLIQTKNLDCVVVYKPLALTKSPQIKKELIDELSQAIGNL
jgi:ribonuclease P protein component